MREIAYSVRNLCACYGKKTVLRDLSLDIPPGLVSLIGPNGSGKSTFLRVLAGLMAYSGNVILHDSAPCEALPLSASRVPPREALPLSASRVPPCEALPLSASRVPPTLGGMLSAVKQRGDTSEVRNIPRREFARNAAFVMSGNSLRPSYPFSVREIIEMGRLPYRGIFSRLTQSDIDAVNQSAEILGITHLLERDIMTLSDGERQLAFLACSLAQDTGIILLDEPTSALDPDKSAKVFALLRTLADGGRSIIAAVHDINLSLSYSDYYIALRDGELISHGRKISGSVLRELYGTEFIPYNNKERNDSMWRALP